MPSLVSVLLGTWPCTPLFIDPPRQFDDSATIVQRIQNALVKNDSPRDGPPHSTASEGLAALFKKVGPAGIPALQAHSEDSIALQAAWQDVVVTVLETESRSAVRPGHDKLAWFLGFLEGRARMRAPKWWADSLLGSRAYARDNIYPGRNSEEDWIADHHKS